MNLYNTLKAQNDADKSAVVTCYEPEGQNDCVPPADVALKFGWYRQMLAEEGNEKAGGSSKRRYWLNSTSRDDFLSKCLFHRPFTAIVSQYDPPYKVCQKVIVTSNDEEDNLLIDTTEYFPQDHARQLFREPNPNPQP